MQSNFIKSIIIATALAMALPAYAQTSHTSRVRPFPITPGDKGKNVDIAVSYQFFLQGDTGELNEQAKLANDGRKQLYRMFAKECEVLLDTIANECAITRANVSSQAQNYRTRREGIRISGSATYRIELKNSKQQAAAPEPTPAPQ